MHRRAADIFDTVRQDLAYSCRSLRRNPSFTMAVAVTLALGVGATTSIFSVVNGVLLRPLPYDDPGRITAVFTTWTRWPGSLGVLSKPDILDLQDLPAFEAVV